MVKNWCNVLSKEGVTVCGHHPECRVTFGSGDIILLGKIPVPTIELPKWRFQTFLDISLPEKLIGKSHRPQNKTFIRGASPGVSDELWDKNVIGGRRWDVATQERKVCNMEIEIVTFIDKGNAKLTVPTDWQEQIQVGSRCVALRCVFDLKLRGIHLTEIILKVWVINGQNVVNVSICEVELRC